MENYTESIEDITFFIDSRAVKFSTAIYNSDSSPSPADHVGGDNGQTTNRIAINMGESREPQTILQTKKLRKKSTSLSWPHQ